MNTDRVLRAIANGRRLQILEWLRSPTEHFPPQVDGDLVKDGVCGILIAQKLGVSQPTVSEKMKALLTIARAAQKNGRLVTPAMVDSARQHGATDREIHDTVLITALFSLYNRYVDGLNTITPEEPAFYDRLGHILQEKGYLPSADRYTKL